MKFVCGLQVETDYSDQRELSLPIRIRWRLVSLFWYKGAFSFLFISLLSIYLMLFILKHISARSESTGWYQKYDISQSQTCQLLSWSLRYYNHVYHVHSEITIDLVTWDAIYEHSKLISASASASPFLLYPWPIYSLTFIRNPLKIVPRKMLYR